jgi:site-specific DNA-methyltransferase (adenine-specific)
MSDKLARRKPTVLERPEAILAMLAENRAQIERALTAKESNDTRKRADAIRELARLSGQEQAIQNTAAENALRARRRTGQLLPKTIPSQSAGRPKASQRATLTTLEDLDITRSDSERWQLLADWPEFEAHITKVLSREGGELTTAAALTAARAYFLQQKFFAKPHDAGQAVVVDGDALEYLTAVPARSFDLLLTDPPYSTNVPDLEDFVKGWLPLALHAVKPQGRAYICIGAYPREVRVYLDELERGSGWRCEDLLVWTFRNTIGPAGSGYSPNWHAILHLVTDDSAPLRFESLTDRFAVLDIAAPDGRREGRLHAWQKPDELADRLVRHAGTITRMLDPFAGTGTFVLAAARAGVDALGCERDPDMLRWCAQRGVDVVAG